MPDPGTKKGSDGREEPSFWETFFDTRIVLTMLKVKRQKFANENGIRRELV